ncbi:rCG64406 [Rattus norvegicus]|uniref:RCG64406 n=1 Tax=Rattus norvegicus TaxID=10116 RepID=A6J1N5_RAT|nr:rCG64406 [Rattus norvegicus]
MVATDPTQRPWQFHQTQVFHQVLDVSDVHGLRERDALWPQV